MAGRREVQRPEPSSARGPWISSDALATVVAPATLISAFLAYFGYARSRAYFGYFGIGQGLLNLPLESYLLRSADVTFRAAATLVGFALVLTALSYLFEVVRVMAPLVALIIVWIAVASAFAATSLGLYFALGGQRPETFPAAGPPILLALGSATLARCLAMIRRDKVWSSNKLVAPLLSGKAATVVLLSAFLVAAFWAATITATEVGYRSARMDDAYPERLALITVFSTEFLDLPVTGDDFTEMIDGDKSYYRYSGLRLLTYSDGRWFLLTGRISPAYAASVDVVAESDSIRIEIADRR